MVLAVLLALVLVGAYLIYRLLFTNYGYVSDWKRNHDFKIPEPQKIEKLYETSNFNGEGQFYGICSFDSADSQEVKDLPLWKTVAGDEELASLSQRIDTIKGFVADGGNNNPFTNHPFALKKGSKYYLNTKSDGSTFLAILEPNNQVGVLIDSW